VAHPFSRIIVAFVSAVACSGCHTGFRAPPDLGPPDLLCEHAGDMGRYLLPADKPEDVWKPYQIEYFYLDRNLKVTVMAYDVRREALSPETRQIVQGIVQRYNENATRRP